MALPYSNVATGRPQPAHLIKPYLFFTLLFLGFSFGWVCSYVISSPSNDRNNNDNPNPSPSFNDFTDATPTILFQKVLDGECSQSSTALELRMFEGDGDNGDTSNSYSPSPTQVANCAQACEEGKRSPLGGGTWSSFTAVGFIVNSSGRCWCENTPVRLGECEDVDTVTEDTSYSRYDFVPIVKIMDGECGQTQDGHMELRMFEGNGDNGDPNSDAPTPRQIAACGNACINKKPPLNSADAIWDFFELEGFVVKGGGRCYCENTRVIDGQCVGEEVDVSLGYDRYNLLNSNTDAYFMAVAKLTKNRDPLYSNVTKLNDALINSGKTIHNINEW